MSPYSSHTLILSLLPPQGLVLRTCPLLRRTQRTTPSIGSTKSWIPDVGADTSSTSSTGRDSAQKNDAGSPGRMFWTLAYSRTSTPLIPIVLLPEAVAVPVVGPSRQLELAVGEGVLSRIHQRQHQIPSPRPLVPTPRSSNYNHLSSPPVCTSRPHHQPYKRDTHSVPHCLVSSTPTATDSIHSVNLHPVTYPLRSLHPVRLLSAPFSGPVPFIPTPACYSSAPDPAKIRDSLSRLFHFISAFSYTVTHLPLYICLLFH
jgi:hypothetical protein